MANIINPYRFATSGGGFSNDYSVEFDGVDQHCDLGFGTPATSRLTWSGWVKTTDTTGVLIVDSGTGYNKDSRGGIMWYSGYWYLSMGNGETWSYSLNTLDASAALDGNWHHVAAVIDGYDWTVYVDGEEDCTWTATVSAGTASSYDMAIGAAYNLYFPIDGKIDEVAFFTSALSSSDITAIYNSGKPASLSSYSPYGWWRMGDNDSGSGTTITDQGSGGNDGTLENSPTYSTDVPT